MEIRGRKYPEPVRPIFFFAVLMILFGFLAMGYGFRKVESQGECYRKVSVCHGIPGESCIGMERDRVVEKSCGSRKTEIRTVCREFRERSCRNQSFSGNPVYGRECRFWSETLGFERKSCSEIS